MRHMCRKPFRASAAEDALKDEPFEAGVCVSSGHDVITVITGRTESTAENLGHDAAFSAHA